MENQDKRELLSEFKFYESYSRFNDATGTYETWDEAIERVMNMHRLYYKDKMTDELENLMKQVEDGYKKKLFLGAQRALQFGGEQLLRHHARLYNCSASYLDRPAMFGEAMYLMLCGCGVGFSVQKHHIEKLPKLSQRGKEVVEFVIEDSIEGWAKAVDVLISSFLSTNAVYPEFRNKEIVFDYNQIRAKGAFISGGFKAPGAEPLKKAMKLIEDKLHKISVEKRKMESIEAYDIVMYMADAVIAGGVRRSATICIFSPDDQDMLTAKTGAWFVDNPQRGRSNNSALLLRDGTTKAEFHDIFKSVKEFGEPGFIWTNDLESLYNPCVTEDTLVTTSNGTKKVKDLIGVKFNAVVDGKEYPTTDNGFWYTGTKEVFKLITNEGYELELTDNHKLLCNKNEWKELKNITLKDKINLHNHENYEWSNVNLKYNEKDGINLGYYISGNKNLEGLISDLLEKGLPKSFIEEESKSFYIGYMKGLFNENGSLDGTKKTGLFIRLVHEEVIILKQVQRMLLKLGIFSKINENKKINGYKDSINNDLIINNHSLYLYLKIIGLNSIKRKDNIK